MDKSTSSNPALPTNLRKYLPNPLYQEVVALRQQVDALRQQFQRFSGWKSRNRSRTRSNFSRSPSRSLERKGSSKIRYYHSKFGKHAKRCRSPYSGSDVSCLPVPEMFKKLSPEPLQLFVANNSKILTYGSKLLNIDLGLRRNLSWKFLIAFVPIPIIGADLLENFGLLVDLKRRNLIDSVTMSGISAATDTISVKLISAQIKKKIAPFGLGSASHAKNLKSLDIPNHLFFFLFKSKPNDLTILTLILLAPCLLHEELLTA
ncbi:transposon Ty3-G Gag-Pol polyprotein [Trichonephila inaurata madagascariensis]|uniref:Transposon Ty3-G Gag-Pol polyprotein n=1 Tax=Trichonephila inaurata madagascariensis TaxID=2747483 RepID=A0A8X6WMW0_9ARAC|nr:transposon Ty3-G Gag-Pol polyprotein [Trichonephila inaurata madagascariensis]